jgi:hypothetical protein
MKFPKQAPGARNRFLASALAGKPTTCPTFPGGEGAHAPSKAGENWSQYFQPSSPPPLLSRGVGVVRAKTLSEPVTRGQGHSIEKGFLVSISEGSLAYLDLSGSDEKSL